MVPLYQRRAFTLVELLVVIAIIALIATISVIALGNARAKSRDSKRTADIKQVQTALEMFFSDNGRYPTANEWGSGSLSVGDQVYLAQIPQAPSSPDGDCTSEQNSYSYTPSDDGSNYSLSFCLGASTGSLSSGTKIASATGITNGSGGNNCTPDCSGKNCGDDGCGGSCGTCTNDQTCSSGTCTGGTFVCGTSQVTVSTLAGHTCNTGSPDYDRCTYDTVSIGSQCWLKQNINLGSRVNGSVDQANNATLEKYCQNDNSSNCTSYGALYQWNEAMQYSVSNGAQGVCPAGWHISTHDEFTTLERAACTSGSCNTDFPLDNSTTGWRGTNEGTRLSATNSYGTDNLGFSSLSGGFRDPSGSFNYLTTEGFYWTSTTWGGYSWFRWLSSADNTNIFRGNPEREYAFSIRCVKN